MSLRYKTLRHYGNDYFHAHFCQTDLETYQGERRNAGRQPATIDMEIKIAQIMVTKAFDNDILDGRALETIQEGETALEEGQQRTEAHVEF